jgi:hypothetical protein
VQNELAAPHAAHRADLTRRWVGGALASIVLEATGARDEVPRAPREALMMKKLVRSYTLENGGELEVVSWNARGEPRVLSRFYETIPRDRHHMNPDTYLDVFRYDDGDLTWSGSPNGHDGPAAESFKLLLDAFTQDLAAEEGAPRAF